MTRRAGICLALAMTALAAFVPAAQAAFGFQPGTAGFSVAIGAPGGGADTKAGSHPLEISSTIDFEPGPSSPGEPGVPHSDGDLRDLEIDLPPGLVENPAAVEQCTPGLFHTPRNSPYEASQSGESCPQRSQVGTVEVRSSHSGGTRTFGLFNLTPPPGAPSEFGFNAYGAPITFVPEVRQAEGEYGLNLVARNVSTLVNISGLTLNVWGAPWATSHDGERGNCLNEAAPGSGWAICNVGSPIEFPVVSYLTLPTGCGEALNFSLRAKSWEGVEDTTNFAAPPQGGCENVVFSPIPSAKATSPRASS